MVDGLPVLVTQDLEIALRHVCHKRMMVRLWVDALCINQPDLEERAQQVLLIREMFAKAGYSLI